VIGRTTDESSPAWPRPLRATAGAPNVLWVVLDDTGFGQLGCYGSPIATPNIDALAAGGLRYTNMHTTALCSPSRSCIITGRNHHANATASDNTVIMVVSDNGASAEGGPAGTTNELQFFNNATESLEDSLRAIDELGGPTTFNHYQYAHVIDMLPTVLDVLGIEAPGTIRGVTQSPIHGVSFAHTFDDPAAPTRHRTQYFEMFGHRAIDHDGWRAVCPWPGPSFAEAGQPFGALITAAGLTGLDARHWELYHVAQDPAENNNLAGQHRDKLIEMIARWYVEAGRYNVLPVDGSTLPRLMVERPQIAAARIRYTYRPGTQTVPFAVGPRVLGRPHAITAEVGIPAGGAEGVLLCQGTGVGGWTFFLADGKLHYVHNYVRRARYRVSSPDLVPEGRHQLRFEFEPTGKPDFSQGKGAPGRAQLYVDGQLLG
jgi:Sulfatase